MMRPIVLTLGVATLAIAWFGVLLNRDNPPFATHMAVHMAVVAVAAPLLALGIRGSYRDPVRRAPQVFSPMLASVLELAVVWFWHTPVLHELARQSALTLIAEQASFLVTGFFLWISVVGGEPENRRAGGIVALLLTAMHMTLLGALLALSQRPFYAHPDAGHESAALDDQHLGGAIMLLVGGLSYLVGALGISWNLLNYRKP